MKRSIVFLSGLMLVSLMSCGPSQQEQDKQKRIDDSLFEKDRNTALDNANKLLADTSKGKDTSAKKTETKKK
jgi:hypothetical protein